PPLHVRHNVQKSTNRTKAAAPKSQNKNRHKQNQTHDEPLADRTLTAEKDGKRFETCNARIIKKQCEQRCQPDEKPFGFARKFLQSALQPHLFQVESFENSLLGRTKGTEPSAIKIFS